MNLFWVSNGFWLRGNLSAGYPKFLPIFMGTGKKKRPLLEAGGRGLKEVKNEVNADVGGRGVWGRGDLSNAARYRAERD